jgi:hypothetical protein
MPDIAYQFIFIKFMDEGSHFDKTDVKMVVTFLRNFFFSSARDAKTECAIWGNQ